MPRAACSPSCQRGPREGPKANRLTRPFSQRAGACPLNADGTTAAVGDHAGQAAQCIATLRGALAAAVADLTDVISTRVLVASTRQAVTVLGCDDQLVEIEAVAALVD
ncbi:RidA family protein [Microbacterium sp. NPDC055521]